MDPKTPVAKIDGQVVTAGELDETLKKDLRRMELDYLEKRYQTRRQGLDQLIAQRLVERKAKAEKLSPEELLKREVADKIPEPNSSEVQQVYDRAKASGRPLPPFDQVKGEIAKFIKSQKGEDAIRGYHDKLRAEAQVETTFPAYRPPRIEVAAEGPSKGASGAPITIVEFSDFQCPFCSRVEPTVDRVMEDYKGKVRLFFRDFPLPFHEKAPKAHEAALCANDQGKYWEMHKKLFANQQALDVEQLKGYAKDLQLDGAKFDKCLDSGSKAATVEAHKKAGEEAGVTGTPAFFINGRMISGAQPYEQFKELIDAELAQR
jgi:protein-disulfide isomerase